MTSRRDFLKMSGLGAAALVLNPVRILASDSNSFAQYASKRPPLSERKFVSKSVEETILRVKSQIKDAKLAWMFENCFPNTLDTTVKFKKENGVPDTFVITGDIDAMWLRDSSAQVWPYLPLMQKDEHLREMIEGLIRRQTKCILIDPYANAFNPRPLPDGPCMNDGTDMNPMVFERKWEIDSLCYSIRLAYHYWKKTGDTSVFNADWKKAMALVVKTFKEQQRKDSRGSYSFLRVTDRQLDTLNNVGYGNPVNPVGLIASSFRPSDDATTFAFLIPSNLFAITSLMQLAEISEKVTKDTNFAKECKALAAEVKRAVKKHAILQHPVCGKVYPYEVDGFGNNYFMDDPNVPSLLSLPYLGCVSQKSKIYQRTREMVWSENNPYFFRGQKAVGIGSPHIGTYDMIWPMSIIMYALTSDDDNEIKEAIRTLRDTDANTGFMHETFHKNDPENYTRDWFAWVNTLFGELILKLEEQGKLHLLE